MAAAAGRGVPRHVSIVGREAELELVRRFVHSDAPVSALVLAGSPGVGKTTLWEAGVAGARERELRVLATRASDAETELAFTGLGDLLEDVALDDLPGIPAPRRQALGVALLREETTEEPPDRRAIGMALLDVLRELAARGRVIIAIDDTQWLDPASSEALVFAARRLGDEQVGFLLTRRTDGPVGVEHALQSVDELDLAGLSVGAVRRMLVDRLGVVPDRRVLRRIVDVTGGNPFFALEIGRTLAERGARGDDLPLPDDLEELLGVRVSGLARDVRKVVQGVALGGILTVEQIEQLAARDGNREGTVDRALACEFLVLEDAHVRPAHPLLAAAVRSRMRPDERRELHRVLADVSGNTGAQARHLALATDGLDEPVATRAALAADEARARGALDDAIELGEHAVRLSPAGAARADRVLTLADDLYRAYELGRLNQLLARELESLPPGSHRARAHFLLSIAPQTIEESDRHLERALAESADDPALHAVILAETSVDLSVTRLERLDAAEARAHDALLRAGPQPDERVLEAAAWVDVMRGRPLDEPRPTALGDYAATPNRVTRMLGIQAAFRGETARARGIFVELLQRASERGEDWYVDQYHHQLCELELRAGNCIRAAELIDVLTEEQDDDILATRSERLRLEALLAATRGEPDDADRLATEGLMATDSFMLRWNWLENHRARGLVALQRGEPSAARDAFAAVWAYTTREGIDNPGAFPVAPDLVEALVAVGELDEARQVTDRLRGLAQAQRHPWAEASVLRCDALVGLTNGTDEEAVAALNEAAAAYGELGLRFDEARTALALGRAERRRRKWAVARTALERAAEVFEQAGATGWQATAKDELARVGGRRPRSPSELTPTETRVVELAAGGLSNKEIAGSLFVTVHTVELHLSHAYAKLGVRSRSQLSGRLAAGTKD
ncbi:MAG TPA: LuxR family transcriptional regulator [Gaiella sp.]|nr:LuxR family transcriptional regulator [Gaiella sp.]